MKTKEQALNFFHNAVGLAIANNLCESGLTRKDILNADLWTPEEIAEEIESIVAMMEGD